MSSKEEDERSEREGGVAWAAVHQQLTQGGAAPSSSKISGSLSPEVVPCHLGGRTRISLKETVLGKLIYRSQI